MPLVDAKPLWKSKTFWVNALAAAAVVLTDIERFLDITAITLPDWTTDVVVLLLALVNIILRLITKQPVTFSRDRTVKHV